MVQDQWGRMWHDLEDDVKLGDGVNFGLYHAGMTYTHLKGVRPRMGDFSYAITQPASQAVGLLVKLDAAGKPLVDPYSDLAGETIVESASSDWRGPYHRLTGDVTSYCTKCQEDPVSGPSLAAETFSMGTFHSFDSLCALGFQPPVHVAGFAWTLACAGAPDV